MQSKATTVEAYLKELPEDRRKALEAIRKVFKKNLGKGYEEGMQYGMIGYFVPHSVYPDGYHCDPKQPLPFAGLASQKNHMSMYMMCIYGIDEHRDRFIKGWEAAAAEGRARKLDMGKACIRFKKLEDVPLDVVGEAIKRVPVKMYIEHYESVIKQSGARKPAAKKAAKKAGVKPAAKKTAAKKATGKKAAIKKTAAKKSGSKKAAAKKAPAKKAATRAAGKASGSKAARRS
ncbi:MAG: DUF1801 domain-containing protein [Phycisphaerales bacterium JB054]